MNFDWSLYNLIKTETDTNYNEIVYIFLDKNLRFFSKTEKNILKYYIRLYFYHSTASSYG